MGKVYIVVKGKEFSPEFKIVGYKKTKEDAVRIVNSLGYTVYNVNWGYWEMRDQEDDGSWMAVFTVEEIQE